MTFDEYSVLAHATATHTIDPTEILVGLVSEHGEVLEEIKRMIRNGGVLTEKVRTGIMLECGDVLWYLSESAQLAGQSLHFIAARAEGSYIAYQNYPHVSLLMAGLKMVSSSGNIADVLTESLVMGLPVESDGFYGELIIHLKNSLAWMMIVMKIANISMEEVMVANLNKLESRKVK